MQRQLTDSSICSDVEYARQLVDLLTSTYGSIDALEGELLKRGHGLDLSVSESHLLETVGRATLHTGVSISVSKIGLELGIKTPSATVAVNRMVKKGLLKKSRNPQDGRRVDVVLTHRGEAIYRLHAIFHQKMADNIAGDMTAEERRVLLAGLRRLDQFYAAAIEEA
jgi:DNA-binding MarR family transcriptional regulator